jgi:hypothetical protein
MQEKMVYAAQENCYEESAHALQQYLRVEVNAMQIHRVANTYGAELEKEKVAPQVESSKEDKHHKIAEVKPDETVYAEMDGSMILTREEGWKEVKLGRVFKESDCLTVSSSPTAEQPQRGWIQHSEYEACMGNHRQFTQRFERHTEPYRFLGERLIFISDGATWIKNWTDDNYSRATQVLDWYHCKEHLCTYAEHFFKDAREKQKWIDKQSDLLHESKTAVVLDNIRALPAVNKQQREAKRKLLQYYENNISRMDYQRYRAMGAGIIGSGAIEAANRQVVQKRMKLSGQRWSKKGAQHILNLRTAYLSGKWNKVVGLINAPLKKAA